MAFDEKRFPELIRELYKITDDLTTTAGRPFTPDGHLVGSLAECFAEHYYEISLYRCSHPGHDGHSQGNDVEIKSDSRQCHRIAKRTRQTPCLYSPERWFL
jgi:hypothetical protein